ncbi:IS110 family transposase, partial [Pediococcus argentinicus]
LTSFDNIVIGLEATSVYDIHPAMFFQLDEDLNQLPLSVTTLNPKYTYRFSQLFDDDKTDQNDALHIADYLRMEHYQTPVLRQEEYLALQRLTRERFHIVGQITDCKHHFLNNLFYKLNRAEAELPTSVFGSAMMEVLTNRYSLDEISET